MHVDEEAHKATLARLASLELDPLDVTETLIEITSALPDLFQVDGAGVLLVDDDQVLRCISATDPLAKSLEATQEESGRGPCVDSFVDGIIISSEDMAAETRWPGLSESLAVAGVRGLLAVPVTLGGAAVGSLNVYNRDPYAWDQSDITSVQAFANLVGHFLTLAAASDRRGELVAQLGHALEARIEIERAVGMLMVIGGHDSTAAFEQLRRVARATRRPVREVAQLVVRERRAPELGLET